MNKNRSRFFWGLFLIVIGAFALINNTDLMPDISEGTWIIIFAAAAVVSLIGYAISGVQEWPLLIPAALFGGLAAVLGLTREPWENGGDLAGGIFMICLSLPFWVAFLTDRKTRWWGLIPAWVLAAIGALLIALPVIGYDVFPSLVLFAIGLPFLLVYMARREHWWALIPAGILLGIGAVLLGESALDESWFATLMTLVIALPFWVVYLARSKEHWWALIPAGILTTSSAVTLIAVSEIGGDRVGNYAGAAFFAGLALTFGLLWLRRGTHPATDWAKFPAAVIAVIALVVLFVGEMSDVVWAVGLILFGAWLLYRAVRPGAT